MTRDPSSSDHLDFRNRIVGIDNDAPLLDGSVAPYVYLDNAASTPPLRDVMDAVEKFMPYYSSVHRGTGFKSRLSTVAYEQARISWLRFPPTWGTYWS